MSCIYRQVMLRIPAKAIGIRTEEAYDAFEKSHLGSIKYGALSSGSTDEKRYFGYVLADCLLPEACALDCYDSKEEQK